MKKLLIALAIFATTTFGGFRPANALDSCYKVEFQDETFSYVAPETGSYTFKGGNVEHSPNGYLITVDLIAGEVWVVPEVNGRPGAAISHVVICPTDHNPTDPDNPDCIYKDPAVIRYATVDQFRMHGRILPTGPLDYSSGMQASLITDSSTLAEFGVTATEIEYRGSRVVAKTPTDTFIVRPRPGGLYSLKIVHFGDIAQSGTDQIVFDFVVGDQWFQVGGTWRARKSGWFLSNKSYLCPVIQ